MAAGGTGSIDAEATSLTFGADEATQKAELANKPADLAFADFNGDGIVDLVVYWSYSGKEGLYLGWAAASSRPVIVDQEFLELQQGQPLLVADIDGDGHDDVLLVQPGFVRVLKVDDKRKLYVERQFNWKFGAISRLVPYPAGGIRASSPWQATWPRSSSSTSRTPLQAVAAVDLAGSSRDR